MNIGDYVRTKKGIIGKIKVIDSQLDLEDLYLVKRNWYYKKDIIKSSPNIIDLIEVGDYVNGEKVCYLKGQINEEEVAHEEDVLYTEYIDEYGEWYGYAEDEIESIVTHEMFESVEYKIGE